MEPSKLVIQSGSIQSKIEFAQDVPGLVPLLNQFVKLWFGTLTEDYVTCEFINLRKRFVAECITVPLDSDLDVVKNNWAFRLWMCRVAQNTPWRWPGTSVSYEPEAARFHKFNLNTGNSRLFATGMCKKNPWELLHTLLVGKNAPDNTYVSNPVEITDDQMLHEILNVPWTQTQDTNQVTVCLKFELQNFNNLLSFVLLPSRETQLLDDPQTETIQKCWDNLMQWRQKYPQKPKIKIHTNWPHQIHNFSNFWDIVEIVPSQPILDDIQGLGGRVGALEGYAVENYQRSDQTVDHVLYVIDPRPIELADLLVWMDLTHNVFVESEWKFLLYRKSHLPKKNLYINTSYIMQ